jgi:hypothetical protein
MLLLSADDMLTPGSLRRASRLLDAHPDMGFVFGRAITTDDPEKHHQETVHEGRWRVMPGLEFLEQSCREGTNMVSTPTAVVRTSMQQALGGYLPELPHTGDLEMWLRFAAHGNVGVIDAEQGFYRVHGKNMHKETYPNALTILGQHQLAFEILFTKYGHRIATCERLEGMAKPATANGAVRRARKLLDQGDAAGCTQLLDAVGKYFPPVRHQAEWRRLRWRRLLGKSAWELLRKALKRGTEPQSVDKSPFGGSDVFRIAEEGWTNHWPGESLALQYSPCAGKA